MIGSHPSNEVGASLQIVLLTLFILSERCSGSAGMRVRSWRDRDRFEEDLFKASIMDIPDGPKTDPNLELELVVASYCFVGDDAVFNDCLDAWSRKLDEIQANDPKSLKKEENFLSGHLRGLQRLVEQIVSRASVNPIETAVIEVDAPAMVLTPTRVVAAMNAAARERFDAVQEQKNDLHWLDPVSKPEFRRILSIASARSESARAIVRTVGKDDERGLAEVFTVAGAVPSSRLVAVRALETEWSDQAEDALVQAFALTKAECDVARLLYTSRDLASIARSRGTSLHTTRTQLQTILRKTGTVSQVDLIRLLGFLTARTGHDRRDGGDAWRDPWGNERVLTRPDGRPLAYSWTGAPDGHPALLVHGSVQGYILGRETEQRLARENIKLYAISRPGFGRSVSDPNRGFIEDQIEAVDWFLQQLNFQGGIPAIGLGNGSMPLLQLAAKRRSAFSRLLVMGVLWPLSPAHLGRLTPTQRALAGFGRLAPHTAEMFVKISRHYIRKKGIDWYLARGWGDVPEVQATLADPDIIPLIRNACQLSVSGSSLDFIREMQGLWKIDRTVYERITCPVHHIHGEYDRSVSAQEGADFAKIAPHFSTECVKGAGYFLLYEKPDLFADRMIELIQSGGQGKRPPG